MLNQDQTEALQELANIGMGQAAADIAHVWQELVTLSVPRIHQVPVPELPALIHQLVGAVRVSAVRQDFDGCLRGEALVLVTAASRQGLDALTGQDGPVTPRGHRAHLLMVGELLARSCLRGIAQQLGGEIACSACALVGEDLPVAVAARAQLPSAGTALCLELSFRIEAHRLAVHLVLLLPHDALVALASRLDAFLEELMSD